MTVNPLYLVDASIYIFRYWFSIPDNFTSRDGMPVNAVYGYTNFLLDLLERNPEFISFAFDESLTTCFRNDIYPDYKANRDLPDETLEFQLARCQEITALLGFHCVCMKDYEADDIIGTLMARLARKRPVIIVTRDKDLGQLLREQDRLWDYAANQYAGPREVAGKFGVAAHQLADFLALAGDTVDNIPGAPGIGARTAASLLGHFGSLDALLKEKDRIHELPLRGAARIHGIIERHEADIRLDRRITGIKCDIPMSVKLQDLKPAPGNPDALAAFCDEMEFGGRIRHRIEALSQKHA
ncbi:MAG: hypothetical protein HUJ31_19440 [Pseudomonadales bacterium]|nr:hypothetical protein [Pseudomonadales bacterium]